MEPTWRVEITFREDERKTQADAVLDRPAGRLHGWGRTHRDPGDPDVPRIGEDVAAARALIRLGHWLLGEAEDEIEEIEQRPVHIHV
jgi:hypothetical protein